MDVRRESFQLPLSSIRHLDTYARPMAPSGTRTLDLPSTATVE